MDTLNKPFAHIDAEQGSPHYRRLPTEFREMALNPQNFTKDEGVELPSEGKIKPGVIYDIRVDQDGLNDLKKAGSYFLSKVEKTQGGNHVWANLSYTFTGLGGKDVTLFTSDGIHLHPNKDTGAGWVKFTELKAPTKN
jgi:hypothetical protein